MISLFTSALALLEQGRPLVEATVILQQGSTPRTAGAKMIIAGGDFQEGTVGGGLLEGEVIRHAGTALATGRACVLSFDLSGKDAAAQGMICGGRTQVLLDFLPATSHARRLFEQRLKIMDQKQPGCYLTILRADDPGGVNLLTGREACIVSTGHCLLLASGELWEPCDLPQDILTSLRHDKSPKPLRLMAADNILVVVETLVKPHSAFFFGAGHVALHAARFAAQVGFRVVVVDDRSAFANPARFPDAARTLVIPDFGHAFADLDIDAGAFLVIATRGHIHDRTVLSQALQTEAAYIGMIGSRSKRETVYQALIVEGVSREALNRVHCPIGLPIGAETPEEIGISIVAQMIQNRSELAR